MKLITVRNSIIYAFTLIGLCQSGYSASEGIDNRDDEIVNSTVLPYAPVNSFTDDLVKQNASLATQFVIEELVPPAYSSYFSWSNLQYTRDSIFSFCEQAKYTYGQAKRFSIHASYLFFQGLTATLNGVEQALSAASQGAQAMSQVCEAGAKFCLAASQGWVGTGSICETLDGACKELRDEANILTEKLKVADQHYLDKSTIPGCDNKVVRSL